MQQQVQIMLDLQNEMNTKVHADWREQGFEWYRAIWIECAEMLDHYGWKWWKKQDADIDQVSLELIDIWHFGLSLLILENVQAETIAQDLQSVLGEQNNNKKLFADTLESFVENTLRTRQFSVVGFAQLMQCIDLSFDDLYSGYVGKNVLNFFRQDKGYKAGTYQKLWQGREDNEHLVEIVNQLDKQAPDFKDQLYRALEQRYQSA